MQAPSNNVQIYLGAPIEHESDRAVLVRAIANLSETDAVVMANVALSNRQVDLIIATENHVLVVEAKISNRPLRGSENGQWEFKAATGRWQTIEENYYRQALGIKLAVRDAMRDFTGAPVPYPAAALVFLPAVPAGSEMPAGDHKVSVGGPELLTPLPHRRNHVGWPLSSWHAFAKAHHFTPVRNLDAVLDPTLRDATSLLERYRTAFVDAYQAAGDELVPFPCTVGDQSETSTNIATRAIQGECLLVLGPSGCGKTLLARDIAMQYLATGGIPIVLEGKYFSGSLRDTLDAEAGLLAVPSIGSLLAACRHCEAPVLFIVDAFNECPSERQRRLVRCLRAAPSWMRSNILVTSQTATDELNRTGLRTVLVPEPDLTTKQAIAQIPANDAASAHVAELLDLAKSGLEASIVGQIIKDLQPDISRFALYDTYVRHRMGNRASEAINLLARIGSFCVDNVSFSLSVRDIDRLLSARHGTSALMHQLLEARLLDAHGDRVSFGHELYLNAFSAEAVVRGCDGNPAAIVAAVSAPQHSSYRSLIIGAIDNTELLDKVLQQIDDNSLIVACALGECGRYARQWMDQCIRRVLRRIEDEAKAVVFRIDTHAWRSIATDPGTLQAWTNQEEACIAALPALLGRTRYLDELFDTIPIMEGTLHSTFERLRDEARQKKIALRSALFTVGLDDQNTEIAIGKIIGRLGIELARDHERDADGIRQWIQRRLSDGISDGQLLMFLKLCRFIWDANPLIKMLPDTIRLRWARAPSPLRLAFLDAAQYAWSSSEDERAALVDVISTLKTDNIMLSSFIVEALKSLGGLEDIDYEETVRREIEQALSDPEDPDHWILARSIYLAQFDHPYDGAYYSVIQALPDARRQLLLSLAVRAKDEHRMFSACMILELASFGDPKSGQYIEYWIDLPPADSSFPQDAAAAFVIAHIALGRLHHPLPPKRYVESPEDNAMLACGDIHYWSNRDDLDWADRKRQCEQAWKILAQHELGCGLGALRDCEWILRENLDQLPGEEPVKISLMRNFPDEVANICRRALADDISQHGRRSWTKSHEILNFAVNTLGSCGHEIDLRLLRDLTSHPQLGRTAVNAVKQLEEQHAEQVSQL